ncbi:MAG TPA: SH3 domain-containing protein [Sulfuricurvum sp.]|nr:SH3 domain-containing protein [Sulfuricurvum sp.]
MKSTVYKLWIIGAVIVFNGCSGKQSPKLSSFEPVLKPVLPVCKDGNVSSEFYDPAPPQELESDIPQVIKKVSDLERFPQTILPYVERNAVNQERILEVQRGFEDHFYRPWSYSVAPICAKEAQWPIHAFKGGYGSNLKPVDPSWITELEYQSNFEAFSTVNHYALAKKWMNIRVFPTHKALYKNPALPGNGYPFDLLQNSSVAFNEPLFISHYSKDGSWAYVFTNNASGWVENDGIARIEPEQIALIRGKEKVFITEDKVPLYDASNRFVTYSRIGMVLPLMKETTDHYSVLFMKNSGMLEEMSIPKSSAHAGFHFLNKDDLVKIGTHLLRNTYGWGGMFEERDCSSMIRDMLTPFGIWLPRNSASQAKKGEVISFKGLDNTQKIALIKERGIPFETILYKKGHVLLYVGTYDDTVMVMHNIWGIRTVDKNNDKGRVVIGKAVLSSLELGAEVENFDPENMLLTTLVSMNIFTRESPTVALGKRKEKKPKL